MARPTDGRSVDGRQTGERPVRRVAVWGTGGVGVIAVRAIVRRADLDLVAVRVHDPAKSGRDAGELCGTEPLGVVASDDPATLLAAEPVDGDPVVDCTLTVGTEATASVDGMVATTMRLVNAVHAVVDARPGLVSSLDLPLTLPHDPPPG